VETVYHVLSFFQNSSCRPHFYTVSQKRETLYSCPYLCEILTDFHNSFTDTFSRKLAIKLLIEIPPVFPPHLKCVATLPCEMLMFANRASFCQSLMVSVGMSKLVCTHLIFVDPGAKINGCYYREVLLNQLLLTAIRQVSGDFFVLQVTGQCTGTQGTRDNQDAATGDARIHLT